MAEADLRRKYLALLRKYEALVDQTVERRTVHGWAFRVGWWALYGTSAAMAMVERGKVVIHNKNWLRLGKVRGWRSLDPEGRQYQSVHELTLKEAERLLRSRDKTATVRFVAERGQPVVKARLELVTEDKQRHVLLLIDDVTVAAGEEAELLTLRENLAHGDRLRLLGEIAAGVVHDVGNALNAMVLRLAVLEQASAGQDNILGHLHELERAIQRCKDTLRRTRELASPRGEPGEVDLRALLDDVTELLRFESRDLELAIDARPVGRVRAPANELLHLLCNLILNARDAMGGAGVVEVRLRQVESRACIEVRDHGPGFAPEILPRIFEPFFTTKGKRGMGLGLSLARSVVTSLGGSLRAANATEGGAVVTVELPLIRARPVRARRPARRRA